MLKLIAKKLTKNHHEIPLLYITFDLNKFIIEGKENSCELKVHPSLKDDEFVINQLNSLVDYIRNNYDMKNISRLNADIIAL